MSEEEEVYDEALGEYEYKDLLQSTKILWYILGAALGALVVRRLVHLAGRLGSNQSRFSRFALAHHAFETRYLLRPAPRWLYFADSLNVAEVITGILYWGINWILLLANSFKWSSLPGAMYDGPLAFLSWKTGYFAFANLPLLFCLVGRNNLVSLISGIPYRGLTWFHRQVGYNVTFLAVVHSIMYSVLFADMNYYVESWGELYWQAGVAGTILMSIMTVTALPVIRRRQYEIFLVIHVLFAAGSIAMCYYHMDYYDHWVYATVGVWMFDRVARILSTIYIHFVAPLFRKDPVGPSVASVTEHDGAINVNIPMSIPWLAGQHMFVSFWSREMVKKPWLYGRWHPLSPINASAPNDAGKIEAKFIIRIQNGTTKWLADHVHRQVETGIKPTIKCLIQGPFSSLLPSMTRYSTLLMISGGSGVGYTMGVLEEISASIKKANKGQLTRIVFVWVVRSDSHVLWSERRIHDLCTLLRDTIDVEASIFVTSNQHALASESALTKEEKEKDLSGGSSGSSRDQYSTSSATNSPHVQHDEKVLQDDVISTFSGRPDLTKIMQDVMEASSGPIIAHVCGPVEFTRAVKVAAARESSPLAVLRGESRRSIDVYAEHF